MQHAWQAHARERETKKRPKKKLTFISYMDMHTRNMDTATRNMAQPNGTATLHSHMKQPQGTPGTNRYIQNITKQNKNSDTDTDTHILVRERMRPTERLTFVSAVDRNTQDT